MKTLLVSVFALALVPGHVYAVDGLVLINQSTVVALGGSPYRITQPGSYKLSGNLVVTAAGTDAIQINSDHVTLDLNGFTISGIFAGANCYLCTGVNSSSSGITVKNGIITGFYTGLKLTGTGNLVLDIQAHGNHGDYGLDVSNGTVTRCSASSNSRGIKVTESVLTDSFAANNVFAGIIAEGSTVIRNVATGNLYGIQAKESSLVGSNSIHHNSMDNLWLSSGSISQNNNACDVIGLC